MNHISYMCAIRRCVDLAKRTDDISPIPAGGSMVDEVDPLVFEVLGIQFVAHSFDPWLGHGHGWTTMRVRHRNITTVFYAIGVPRSRAPRFHR